MLRDKIRVLVVDDNENSTDILCDYINLDNDNSIEIVGVASNGFEAIEMITEKQPDIVLLDMIMPYLGGIGVLKKNKTMNLRRKPLFIMLSALGQDIMIQEALDLGAVCYIQKPFDMEVLISKIKQLQSSILINKDFAVLVK